MAKSGTICNIAVIFTNRMTFCNMLNKIRNDFLKHNFETYHFLKQQIVILFSGTLKWNMLQIHLKEMRPMSFKWENYLNSLSSKTVTIFLDRQQKKIHPCVDSWSVFTIDQFNRNPYLIFFLHAQYVLL